MCLIVFAWHAAPGEQLLLAANRDERHDRPTQDAHWWPDYPDILAGRDLQAGGSWLALGRNGRFATVTNYRENQQPRGKLKSRGALVTDFIASAEPALAFAEQVPADDYAGFNLLFCDGDELVYFSNRGDPPVALGPGVYGLANASLDTPWPKLVRSRDALAGLVGSGDANETTLLRILADRSTAPVADIDASELPFEMAKAVSAPFILTAEYGTRSSTVLRWSETGKVRFTERSFDANGTQTGESTYRLNL